jgi:hypothetical protein
LIKEEDILKKYNIIENKSKIYFNGSVWQSLSCGKFTIIGKTDRRTNTQSSYIYCLCKFEDGAIVEANFTNIQKGNVKSPNHPSYCAVGHIGQGEWLACKDGKITKEYLTWSEMIKRCYSKNAPKKSPSYKDITVCERWHCFQNFCEDIQLSKGYEEWKNSKNKAYHLDKDILCESLNIIPKIYSPKTCMFISQRENISESTIRNNLTGLTYVGISPNGDEYEFIEQKEFASEYKLDTSALSKCLRGKLKQHKGWTFKVKDETIKLNSK